MDLQLIVSFIYCLVLPLVLLTACLLRFNILSLVYFVYLLLLPWFLCPNKHTIRGNTGHFIRAIFCTSLLFVFAHVCFQTVLYTYPPLNDAIAENCSNVDIITRHIGLSRLPLEDPWTVLRLLSPDLVLCGISLLTIILCRRLVTNREIVAAAAITTLEDEETDDEDETEQESEEEDDQRSFPSGITQELATATLTKELAEHLKAVIHKVLQDLGKILAIILLALAGIILPSAFSAIYFLLFIGASTWWACHLPISSLGFKTLFVMVGFFTAGHIVCLYLYQCLLAQVLFPPHSLWARLFGLKDILKPGNCSSPYDFKLNAEYDWPVYVNPGILFLLYIISAVVLKTGCHGTLNQDEENQQLLKIETEPKEEMLELNSCNQKRGDCKDDTELMLLCVGADCREETVVQEGPPQLGFAHETGGQKTEKQFLMLGKMVMQQSYVCALIAMMVWSITYHSWLTFVLLLWACLLWILRARRHAAMLCSPFILIYGLALCCLQYVWAMELVTELPTIIGNMSLRQLGLDKAQYPCLRLGAMLLFTSTFWLLVRQSVQEIFSKRRKRATPLEEDNTADEMDSKNDYVLKLLGGIVLSFYAKYWIYVCGGMFLIVSFIGKLVGYKIIYMLLFLLCLCIYQVYYPVWRRLLKLFWWLVVAYTMLVLIAIYTYQFEDFPDYWRNFTGLSKQQLAAIGLETFALSELFTSILIPGFFLLACILQLHYFHKPFMRITDPEHAPPIHRKRSCEPTGSANVRMTSDSEEVLTNLVDEQDDKAEHMPTKWGLVIDRLLVLFKKFSDILQKAQAFLWTLLEIHIIKMVAFYSVWVALEEPSVFNLVLVVLWSLAMPFNRFRPMASSLSTIWVCVIIMCKMLYQLSVVDPMEYSNNCTLPLLNETNLSQSEIMNSSLYMAPVDPAKWFGIRKEASVLDYNKNHLVLLLLLVFEVTVYRHQAHHYRQLQRSPSNIPTLFPKVTRKTLDEGLIPCFKYLLNYTFYKFGLEICFLMTVNVIGQRMNFLVIIHGCWLVAILVRRRRAAIARIWPKYCLFLAIFTVYQYTLCVGIPPALCKDYPWRWNTSLLINSALIKWLYLPDFYTVPNSKNLIVDFVLLMCASQQWKVFKCEQLEEWIVLAGDNTDNPEPMAGRLFNPAPNFVNCRSYLDMAKVLVFRHLFWFVLSVVFITGATRVSVFGLGYLLSCFFFLLFGTQLLVKPSRTRLAMWDCLIIYNVAVIISKNILSILACVFVSEMQKGFCWMIQLFSLVCTVKGYYNPNLVSDENCSLPIEEAGIIWDSVCFLFLLLQRRVFLSYYFIHVEAELQAFRKQASRGFELFKATIMKNIRSHQQAEMKSLSQLKRSMHRIRSKQQRYRDGHKVLEEDHQSQSSEATTKQKKEGWSRPWQDHATVLHSGWYYLFESDSEGENEMLEEQKPQKQTAYQLAYQAWVSNVKTALKEHQRSRRQQRRVEIVEDERTTQQTSQDSCSVTGSDDNVFEDPQLEELEESGRGEIVQRILDTVRFLWAILLALMDGLTQWLNLLTKQYRETSTVLCNERYFFVHKIQQPHTQDTFMDDQSQHSEGPTQVDTYLSQTETYCSTQYSLLEETRTVEELSPSKPRLTSTANFLSPEHLLDNNELISDTQSIQHKHSRTASEVLGDRQFFSEELEQSIMFYSNQNRLLKLLFATHSLLAANSELVCYFIIIMNNLVSGSVISLVMPIMVFLWAMLTVPRPTKTFWMTAIVYTEVMVVVKYLFQFGFFPWNSAYEMTLNEDKPFFPPRILGLEKTDTFIRYDLLQLLALFFHRSLLMRYGLWNQKDPLLEQSHSSGDVKEDGVGIKVERLNSASTSQNLITDLEQHETSFPDDSMASQNRRHSMSGLSHSAVLKKDEMSLSNEEVLEGISGLHLRKKSKELKKQTSQDRSTDRPTKKRRFRRKEEAGNKMRTFTHKLKKVFISRIQRIFRPIQCFFIETLQADYRVATDVYALMFLTDVIDFIVIVFGFWAFGKHSAAADIASTLSEDQVPEAFLVMLLIQFTTMIIDRALYLRKAVVGKLVFQVVLVIGIHLWMFFILPAVTERRFNQNFVAQLWYFFKCIYFALSAYQIRSGYPTRILGNFLTKNYTHLNLFLFQGFRLVPFLVELRAVMDWVWTDTTLSLSNWMCVEDIYANIFIIKCSRETEKKYPQPKGQKKKKMVKYGMGGLIIIFLVCIIWFPLLFISLVRSVVGVVNHPIDVTVTVKLGGYEPLFTMSVQQQSIQPFTELEYEKLTKKFGNNAVAMQFISLYGYEDVVTAMIEGSSGSVWRISPPSRQEVIKELLGSPADLTLRLSWNFQRDLGKGGTVEHTFDKHSINLEPGNPVRADLASLLLGNRTKPVHVPNMFPNYIRAPNGAEAKPASQLYEGDEEGYQNITLSLMTDYSMNSSGKQEWWDIAIGGCSPSLCGVLPMIIFNDKVSPPSLGFLAGYGIMGLYVSVVLVIGKFVRGFFSEISHSIMFEELPCVDRILKLCMDIFLVRETGELELEEELYSKLIFLYRSPETMIKWTRDTCSRDQR
ncbi:piezo-type mechanosensitive ion channel component 1 isoform X1 [Corythoichthys intestinalis]|uniref:piezo-type mechanosensitive ion channel component 1 isoform X1 n=2 Tax=Corythoichthys intestinalis TaxID=161448 RepID=UPI0025A5FAB8|nr:piezo-type mechanosensitive ion channel component 1 isoform X1 [Corythoichthys intestinalis]